MVNAVMNVEHYFGIAEHSLIVVGMDGSYVKPIVTDFIMICPRQTMDMLVIVNQSHGRYYMAARQYDSVRPDVTDYDKSNVTAILGYKGDYTPPAQPIFPNNLPTYEDLMSTMNFSRRIKSLVKSDHTIDVPLNITTRMYMTAGINTVAFVNGTGDERSGIGSSLNNVSWVNPSTDVLHAYYRNMSGFYTEDFPDYPPSLFDFVAEDTPYRIVLLQLPKDLSGI
ncbi:hypothetical protein M0R45_001902 [Rubus argutus]|uniref:Plastocyanin-like domain-containing protein n=1 Tax=Rubus argutus TaxID=59490 RepID=A0AAW1VF11_RUBAR